MSRPVPWKIAMRWSNPHRPRPDGWPEVLAETVIEQPAGKGAPREEEWPEAFRRAIDADERSRPGRGYSLFIGQDQAVLHEQRKAWSPERKAETRLRELRRRVEKDAGPLFAHTVTDLVAVEVNARPDYFDPRRLEAFAERERERSDAFLADRLAYAKTLARGRPLPRAGGSYVDESPAALGRMTPGEHAAWNTNDRTRQWLEVRGWMAGAYALPDGDDAPSTGEERA